MELNEFFAGHAEVAVAFSGGADSAYLLYAAKRYARKVQAYYVQSAFQPRFEKEDAYRLARELQVPLRVLSVEVLAADEIKTNPPDRCYYCKRMIFTAIGNAAAEDGFAVLLDGTNASDDAADRPGMRALSELSVLSPLRLCGLTKKEIRELSKAAGLFTWDKAAYACLATRIPAGEPITEEKLRATEYAENYLSALGFSDFRVRRMGTAARIEIPAEQIGELLTCRKQIVTELKKYYTAVVLNLETRG